MWTVALLAFAFRVVDSQRVPGFDLFVVRRGIVAFLHGESPYDLHFFIYPPSGCLLLSWLGKFGFDADRVLFLLVGVGAILVATAYSLELAGLDWRGRAGAVALLVLALLSPVYSTLQFGNVNSLILLGEALALAAMAAGRWRRAGIVLGLTLAVKPVLVPLLVFPLVRRQWTALGIALLPVVVLSAVATALNQKALDFFSVTVPFLVKGDTTFFTAHNVSLVGAAINLGIPTGVAAVARLFVAAGVVWLALARWREHDEEEGQAFALVETASILLLGTFLCFSIAWQYYGIYLVPLLATITNRRSLMRHPLALAGLFFAASPNTLTIGGAQSFSVKFAEVRPTLGFVLMIAGMAIAFARRRATEPGRLLARMT